VLSDLAGAYGIPEREQRSIALLPERLRDVYATTWNTEVWQEIDRQVAEASRLGLLPGRPDKPLYTATPLQGV
jgi:hypothetical protein